MITSVLGEAALTGEAAASAICLSAEVGDDIFLFEILKNNLFFSYLKIFKNTYLKQKFEILCVS
jgi:hypothetical protein